MEQTFQSQSNPYASPIGGATLNNDYSPRLTLSQVLFSFTGRIPRRTFWGVSLAVTVVFYAIIFTVALTVGEANEAVAGVAGLLLLALYIPVIWISFAVQAKRWHDRGKSGWWILIGFLPVIGAIWTLVECGCLRGSEGSNKYGADPTR